MKKFLVYITSFNLISTTPFVNSFTKINDTKTINNENSNNTIKILQNLDLSKLKIDKWQKDNFDIANVNIDYNKLSDTTTKDYLKAISYQIDKNYQENEKELLNDYSYLIGNVLSYSIDLLNLNIDMKFEILDNSTSADKYNKFKDNFIFNNLKVPVENIFSYNVRWTNLKNDSYFDFSVNISNIQW